MTEIPNGVVQLVPAARILMGITEYQDFLMRVSIENRTEDWQTVQPIWKKNPSPTQNDIVNRLLAGRGYIVPPEQIVPVKVADPANYLRTFIALIKDKLENPELIFCKPMSGYGYAIGIEGIRVARDEGRFLYSLYQNIGKFVPWQKLALSMFGFADVAELYALRETARRTITKAAGTGIEILQSNPLRTGGFVLREIGGKVG